VRCFIFEEFQVLILARKAHYPDTIFIIYPSFQHLKIFHYNFFTYNFKINLFEGVKSIKIKKNLVKNIKTS